MIKPIQFLTHIRWFVYTRAYTYVDDLVFVNLWYKNQWRHLNIALSAIEAL